MLTIAGIVLILLGVLGLLSLIATPLVAEIILIVVGLLLIGYDRGAFRNI